MHSPLKSPFEGTRIETVELLPRPKPPSSYWMLQVRARLGTKDTFKVSATITQYSDC